MRSDKRQPNVDPHPKIVERIDFTRLCLMTWDGPCPEVTSKFYDIDHGCSMKSPHKSRHQCSCGVSRMKQKDDPSWEDK